MADIELVIRMPEEAYNLLKTSGVNCSDAEHILDAVSKGIPLPKGHGRLKDVDAFVPDCQEQSVYYDYDEHNEYTAVGISQIECAPTIIEADMEESEK